MKKEAVVLLHGFGAGPWAMSMLGRHLRRSGFTVLNLPCSSRTRPFQTLVSSVASAAASVSRTHRIHVVGHSMGGLIARGWFTSARPATVGKMVMLGPPNGGSELVEAFERLRIDRLVFGKARDLLHVKRSPEHVRQLGAVTYPLGVIAGDRAIDPLFPRLLLAKPNDGKVSVAATHVDGEADHIVLPVPHALMPYHPRVHRQVERFLRDGCFAH